jgi:hypothetical protein
MAAISGVVGRFLQEALDKIKNFPIAMTEDGQGVRHGDVVVIATNSGNFGVPRRPHIHTRLVVVSIELIDNEIKFLLKDRWKDDPWLLSEREIITRVGSLEEDPDLLKKDPPFTWKQYLNNKYPTTA